MKDFLKAFLSFGLATSIEKLIGFIILPIYTRYFNSVDYGIIDMIGTFLAVLSIFGLLQFETSLQRYYYQSNIVRKKLLVSAIYFWVICFSLIMGLVIYIAAPFMSLYFFKSKEYMWMIRTLSFQLLLTNLSILGLIVLRFEKENAKFLFVILVKVLFSLLSVYLLVIKFKIGMMGVFYAQVFSLLFSTILVTFFVRRFFVFRLSQTFTKKSIRYSLPQIPARIGSVLLGNANRFFMLGYLSLAAIGIYSVSLKLASSIQLVNSAFIMAWTPFLYTQFKKENNKIIFSNVFPLICGVTFLFVCLLSLFSKEIVILLTTEDFYSSYKYVGGLTLFFSLYIIKETVDIGPRIMEKTKFLTYTFALSLIVNLLSLYFFIRIYELEGVIFSMIITNLFLVIISWIVSNKLYYIPFNPYTFILLLFPALSLVITIMYVDINLGYRSTIGFLCVIFYSGLLYRFYRNFIVIINKQE
ncbi:lipopolysaccharide biosynthesis protein [Chryseobacterium sp. JAH]|uniref:lipopolysaccharide biosynthesis protein n=1 Tax=Chryseobacterium sp. JAH TaxID=1742858 RepID=UPI000740D14F|nr:lipopolysaccharide biosynthesis protein [Chryseobacterium sp. JAH]KUJ50597.1 hypothetical protein AR685_14990 [Chryseobacterium sp. JAH]